MTTVKVLRGQEFLVRLLKKIADDISALWRKMLDDPEKHGKNKDRYSRAIQQLQGRVTRLQDNGLVNAYDSLTKSVDSAVSYLDSALESMGTVYPGNSEYTEDMLNTAGAPLRSAIENMQTGRIESESRRDVRSFRAAKAEGVDVAELQQIMRDAQGAFGRWMKDVPRDFTVLSKTVLNELENWLYALQQVDRRVLNRGGQESLKYAVYVIKERIRQFNNYANEWLWQYPLPPDPREPGVGLPPERMRSDDVSFHARYIEKELPDAIQGIINGIQSDDSEYVDAIKLLRSAVLTALGGMDQFDKIVLSSNKKPDFKRLSQAVSNVSQMLKAALNEASPYVNKTTGFGTGQFSHDALQQVHTASNTCAALAYSLSMNDKKWLASEQGQQVQRHIEKNPGYKPEDLHPGLGGLDLQKNNPWRLVWQKEYEKAVAPLRDASRMLRDLYRGKALRSLMLLCRPDTRAYRADQSGSSLPPEQKYDLRAWLNGVKDYLREQIDHEGHPQASVVSRWIVELERDWLQTDRRFYTAVADLQGSLSLIYKIQRGANLLDTLYRRLGNVIRVVSEISR